MRHARFVFRARVPDAWDDVLDLAFLLRAKTCEAGCNFPMAPLHLNAITPGYARGYQYVAPLGLNTSFLFSSKMDVISGATAIAVDCGLSTVD